MEEVAAAIGAIMELLDVIHGVLAARHEHERANNEGLVASLVVSGDAVLLKDALKVKGHE